MGCADDAARIEQRIRALAPSAASEMKLVSVPLDISEQDMARWRAVMAGETLVEGARAIAGWGLMRQSDAEQSVRDSLQHAPLSGHCQINIRHASGFSSATIRSVEDDLPGRATHEASTRIGHRAPFLHVALDAWRSKHNPSADELVQLISLSPIFAGESLELVREGVSAWLANDYVKTIHVLVPRIENAVRDLMVSVGGSVMVPDHNSGGFRAIAMGAVLGSDAFAAHVHADIRFHLRALYTDPKGLNLRNQVAHGLASWALMGRGAANWVMHTILLLAIAFSGKDTDEEEVQG